MPVTDLQDQMNQLSSKEFIGIIKDYARENAINENPLLRRFSVESINEKLIANGVIPVYTNCGEDDIKNINKNGKKNNGLQNFKCKTCNRQFTLFSNTIFQGAGYHWDIWVKILQMTFVFASLETIQEVLVKDYGLTSIDIKTVWSMRLKLVYALSKLPTPTLTGVIQIDETHIYESQKGSRNLINFVEKSKKRLPRKGGYSSKLGVMSAEFSTIVSAIDDRGYTINKFFDLGKISVETFTENFIENFRSPSYICTDLNQVYKKFCEDNALKHYIRPSNYLKVLEEHGYTRKSLIDYSNPVDSRMIEVKNDRIRQRLYKEQIIDYIHPHRHTYGEFNKIKKAHNLSLSRVNSLHADIKHYLNVDMKNVGMKYLEYYLGAFTYSKNFRVKHGRKPASIKDAENILIEIVKAKIKITQKELEEFDIERYRPSPKSQQDLIEATLGARQATGNKYFKFDMKDGIWNFNKREFLRSLPLYRLKEIAKPLKIRNYTVMQRRQLADSINKHPDSADEIARYINNNKLKQISDEDIKLLESAKYVS